MSEKTNHVKFLDEHMENFSQENTALHRKLQSKMEALKIMRNELEQYRTERDQFKLMAETLQLRYTAMKKSITNNEYTMMEYESGDRSKVGAMLNEMREKNIALSTQVENLREKLQEVQGDLCVLRNEKKVVKCSRTSSGGMDVLKDRELEWNDEKSKLISQMEHLKKKNAQLQYDFRALLDEKEEIVTERDAFKCKVHRLNHELNVALKGEDAQSKILDIDALILENKYLQERLKNMENEIELAQQSLAKYKTMLDSRRKKGIIKLGTNNSDMIMSHKQVKTLLERGSLSEIPLNAATISDLKSLCLTLLDNLNDKNLAYSHQKKANKILAERICELETRLQTLLNGKTIDNDQNHEAAAGLSVLSPSQYLLNGYTSSTVDQEKTIVTNKVDNDSGTGSSDCSKTVSRDDQLDQSSFSSNTEEESNKSMLSSEYEDDRGEGGQAAHLHGKLIDDDQKLEDLPPYLAELVRKALSEIKDDDDEDDDGAAVVERQIKAHDPNH